MLLACFTSKLALCKINLTVVALINFLNCLASCVNVYNILWLTQPAVNRFTVNTLVMDRRVSESVCNPMNFHFVPFALEYT